MIVVTGAYGFIGSNLVNKLNEMGETDLILVDDLTNGVKYQNLLNANFTRYYDVDDFLSSFDLWPYVRAVYHQGAVSSTTETNGKFVLNRNYTFTLDLMNRCIDHRIPISYASSASVYGNHRDGTEEPLSLYAYSKCITDQWVRANWNRFKLIQGWRYFNVYGKNEIHKADQASPITKFVSQAQQLGVIKLFEGSENIYRDFVSVDDVVDVVLESLKTGDSGIRDIGTGNPVTFKTIAKLVQQKHNCEIRIVPFPDDLKSQYQYYTCALSQPMRNYITVAEWIEKTATISCRR